MSILSEPRLPDCEVCDWATAHHYAYGLNLCGADLDIVNKVAQNEQERIISLLKIEEKRLYDHANISGSYLVTGLIETIKGENK